MYTVYAIKSIKTGKIYIGHTQNIGKRLARHNKILPVKKKSYTFKNKGPWKLIYTEKVREKEAAMKREKQLKSFRGREFIKSLISGP